MVNQLVLLLPLEYIDDNIVQCLIPCILISLPRTRRIRLRHEVRIQRIYLFLLQKTQFT